MPLPFGNLSNSADSDDKPFKGQSSVTPEDGRQSLIRENPDMANIMEPLNDGEFVTLDDLTKKQYIVANSAAMSVVTASLAGASGRPLDQAKAEYLITQVARKIPRELLPAFLLAIVRNTVELTNPE